MTTERASRPPRPRRLILVAAAVVVVVAVALLAVWALRGDDDGAGDATRPRATITRPVTSSTTTTTKSVPPAVLPITTKPGPGPLDDFRLGFDGLGPIKLGMTLAEASAAANTTIELTHDTSCSQVPDSSAMVSGFYRDEGTQIWFGVQSGRIVNINTKNPVFSTISGIHIGSSRDDVFRTYPAATGSPESATGEIRLTNPQGRLVAFYAPTETGRVGYLRVAENQQLADVGSC